MRIGENLKRIRKQRGPTLAALAKMASLNLNTINRVEKFETKKHQHQHQQQWQNQKWQAKNKLQ